MPGGGGANCVSHVAAGNAFGGRGKRGGGLRPVAAITAPSTSAVASNGSMEFLKNVVTQGGARVLLAGHKSGICQLCIYRKQGR